MITFAIARTKRVLRVDCALAVTAGNMKRLEAARDLVLAREGPMHQIFDFTAAPPGDIPTALARERAAVPLAAPGHRRVHVAPDDHLYGMMRMYSAYQDDPGLLIVRNLDQAYEALDVAAQEFEPLAAPAS